MHSFNQDELQRYRRHFSVPEIGIKGQLKLKNSSILLIGAGGIGAPAALYLAACGIGKIGIIDDDSVELSNLQRQILYTSQDNGKAKVNCAKTALNKLNANVDIETIKQRINADNAADLIAEYDLIIDGSDNYPTRYIVNDACYSQQKPLLSASIFNFNGQLSLFNYQDGPCYRCLYQDPPAADLIPNCAQAGVLGVVPGILASLAVNEAIKLFLQTGENLSGKLVNFDGLKLELKKYQISKHPNCPCCQLQQKFQPAQKAHTSQVPIITYQELQNTKDYLLLDVREAWEHELGHLPNSRHVPLGELIAADLNEHKNQKIVVYCRSGMRSAKAVRMLQAAGFAGAVSLDGGYV